jgi:cell division protein FtsQ
MQEQQVLGLWNENRLLNTYGESFTANLGEAGDDGSLPVFDGPEGSEKLVAQRYSDLLHWMAPLKVGLLSVTLTQRYAWEVALSNGMTIDLGRDPTAMSMDTASLESRVRRFVQAIPVVQERVGSPVHADLRYPNGFAITTAKPTPAKTTKPQKKNSAQTMQPTQKKP